MRALGALTYISLFFTDLAEFVGREVQVVEIAESQGLFLDAESVDILHVKRKFVRIRESGVAFRARARHLKRAREDLK